MSGFKDLNTLIKNKTQFGKGQDRDYIKQAPTTAAFASYDLGSAPSTGMPAAISYGAAVKTPTNVSSATSGALKFSNPTSGETNHLTYAEASARTASATGTLLFIDLLQYINFDMTVAAAQTGWANVPLGRYASGLGVQMALVVTNAAGLDSPGGTITADISYTNSNGNPGNTVTPTVIQGSAQGRIPHVFSFIPLSGSDLGVRSVESLDLTGGVFGAGRTCALILFKELFRISIGTDLKGQRKLVSEAALYQLQDDACVSSLWLADAVVTTPIFNCRLETVSG